MMRIEKAEISQYPAVRSFYHSLIDGIADLPYGAGWKKDVYRVFYVSDNPFADGNRFPDFFAEMHRRYPSWRLDLRHIKDVDGHFVTREEYHRKNR